MSVPTFFASSGHAQVETYQWHMPNSPQQVPDTILRVGADENAGEHDATLTANLADYKGKPVILNFFARWCRPCLQELPAMDKFAKRHGDSVTVMAVGIEQVPYAILRQFFDETLKLKHLMLAQDQLGGLYQKLGYNGLPVTYVIDKTGAMRAFYVGVLKEKDFEYLKRLLRSI